MYANKAATLGLATVLAQVLDTVAEGNDDEAVQRTLEHLRRHQGDPNWDDGRDVPSGLVELEAVSKLYGLARSLHNFLDAWVREHYRPALPNGVDYAIDYLIQSYDLPKEQWGAAAQALRKVLEAHG